jgi:DNA polymerase
VQDIVAEAEVSSLVPDLQRDELEWWQVDQEINSRGIQVDVASVTAAIAIVEEALRRYNGELAVLTEGAVSSASEVARLVAWLEGCGLRLGSLDEEAVEQALARKDLHPHARRALEIRSLVGSASVKKLFAMEHMVCRDGRIRDLYTYHGARTGRATGGAVQPTNLPNHGPAVRKCTTCGKHYGEVVSRCPWCAAVPPPATQEWSAAAMEDAIAVIRGGSLDLVEITFGSALPAISGCLRGMLVAAPGHDLIASDYSAIEAVVLAELAGEEWRREVFRTHGKIYEMSASKISGVPFEEMMEHRKRTGQHHPLRKTIGKVAELASGYQGWVGAWKAFGADEFMSEEEMKTAILKWRAESPNIVEFWGGQTRRLPFGGSVQEYYGIEGAAISAVLVSGQEFSHRGVTYFCQGDVLYCRLLSGRYLTYHRPRLEPSQKRFGEHSLSYEGWNTNPKNGPIGWIRMQTWGGRLVENLVQATARDIQREALVRQERAGYKIVLHVYDENVAEVPEGWGSVEEFEMIMSTMPAWAADWPVRAAGGWRGKRYRKD